MKTTCVEKVLFVFVMSGWHEDHVGLPVKDTLVMGPHTPQTLNLK